MDNAKKINTILNLLQKKTNKLIENARKDINLINKYDPITNISDERVLINCIIDKVEEILNLEKGSIVKPRTKGNRDTSDGRFIAITICKDKTDKSFNSLRHSFGNRDHMTIKRAYNTCNDLNEVDEKFRNKYMQCLKAINKYGNVIEVGS